MNLMDWLAIGLISVGTLGAIFISPNHPPPG